MTPKELQEVVTAIKKFREMMKTQEVSVGDGWVAYNANDRSVNLN